MALSPGTRVGPYDVLALIGAGGMGEVYRARDINLNREVALKTLPDAFAHDPDRLTRFIREAQTLAALNHPHIAHVHGLEQSEGVRALVMELVDGEDLAHRIARGAIPVDDVLPLARQIAEALEAAHEQGIVHRDLKPANIRIRPDGSLKVLDFGLAKAFDPSGAANTDALNSPTISAHATQVGIILGTAAYMAPEQAKGKAVDRRADIWAFGCVLYEMLTGTRAFPGDGVSDTLASVIKSAPELTKLPTATPPGVRQLLSRCLQKDPHKRLQAIGDARIVIEDILNGTSLEQSAPRIPGVRRRLLRWVGAVAVLAMFGIFGWSTLWPASRPVDRPMVRFSVDLGPDAIVGQNTTVAFAPDGTRIVFPARGPGGTQQLATRRLDDAQTVLLPGTENGVDPFFSPTSQWIGFFADGKMKKVSVQGGAPVTLSDARIARGAAWGEDGNIIVMPMAGATGLFSVADSGGTLREITKPADKGQATHRWPQILPGGRVLFTASTALGNYENASIEVLSLNTGQWKEVLRGGYFGRYLPAGYLVYLRENTLFGVRFDVDLLETTGTPVRLLEDVSGNPGTGGGQYDFSGDGTFAYVDASPAGAWPILWLDRAGGSEPLLALPGPYQAPRFSPDGNRLALSVGLADIQVYDWKRDTMTRLTFTGQGNGFPIWTPDGKHIVFRSVRPGGYSLQWIRSDGGGAPHPLLELTDDPRPYSFSPDGRRLTYAVVTADAANDLWTLPLDVTDAGRPNPGKPTPLLRTQSNELEPAMSPDGRWLAYTSDESGRVEVYVRPFGSGGELGSGKWPISAGGRSPIWSRTGRELFYVALDNRIMMVSYTANGDSFAADKPTLYSPVQIFSPNASSWSLDLAPDGQRFAVLSQPNPGGERSGSVHVNFLMNFFEEVRRRIPADK